LPRRGNGPQWTLVPTRVRIASREAGPTVQMISTTHRHPTIQTRTGQHVLYHRRDSLCFGSSVVVGVATRLGVVTCQRDQATISRLRLTGETRSWQQAWRTAIGHRGSDVAGDLLGGQLGVASVDLVLLDVDRCQHVVLHQALVEDDRVLVVVALPRHALDVRGIVRIGAAVRRSGRPRTGRALHRRVQTRCATSGMSGWLWSCRGATVRPMTTPSEIDGALVLDAANIDPSLAAGRTRHVSAATS
jgi:hypothetical protein